MRLSFNQTRDVLHICYGGGGNHLRRVEKQFNLSPEELYIGLIRVHKALQITFKPPTTVSNRAGHKKHLNELLERLDKYETQKMIEAHNNRKGG